MRYVVALFSPIIFLISFFFKKNDRIWVYGAWYGKLYKDNSKALFEEANKLSPEITHVWIYKDRNLKNIPKKYKSLYAYSLEGFLVQLRAKVFICTLNTSDFIPFLVTPRNTIIQLWHGSPLKNIGIDSRKTKIRKFADRIRFATLDNYTYCISPAKFFDESFKSAFLLKQGNILRASLPRNRSLFISDERKHEIKNMLAVKKNEKLILYLPTHRNNGNKSILSNEVKKLHKYDNIFLNNQIKFIVKPHFYELKNFESHKDLQAIKVLLNTTIDLYELLASSDALVTDYSSVFFDYELLSKPILIFPFDLNAYMKYDRNMYFDPKYIFKNLKNTTVVKSEEMLIDYCIKISKEIHVNKGRITSIFNEDVSDGSVKIINAIKNRIN